MIFSPWFFTIMLYMAAHLATDAKLAGHVQYHWMYPFEWYYKMFVLFILIIHHRYSDNMKCYCASICSNWNHIFVINKSHLEGSIAEGCLTEGCMTTSVCKYLNNVETSLNLPQRIKKTTTLRLIQDWYAKEYWSCIRLWTSSLVWSHRVGGHAQIRII